MKVTLKIFSEKSVRKRINFYNGVWGCRLLFMARTNSLEAGNRNYRFNETKDKTCLRCNIRVDESVEHILTECPAYEVDMDKLIREYKGIFYLNIKLIGSFRIQHSYFGYFLPYDSISLES